MSSWAVNGTRSMCVPPAQNGMCVCVVVVGGGGVIPGPYLPVGVCCYVYITCVEGSLTVGSSYMSHGLACVARAPFSAGAYTLFISEAGLARARAKEGLYDLHSTAMVPAGGC